MEMTLKRATLFVLIATAVAETLILCGVVQAAHGVEASIEKVRFEVSDITFAPVAEAAEPAVAEEVVADETIVDEVVTEEVVADEVIVDEVVAEDADDADADADVDADADGSAVSYFPHAYTDEELLNASWVNANQDGAWISGEDFRMLGVHYDTGSKLSYTYYSENVLPGGGLNIPGRHVGSEGYVMDANGYVCLASDNLLYGTVVEIPFGSGIGVVYDCGSGYRNLDVYVSW